MVVAGYISTIDQLVSVGHHSLLANLFIIHHSRHWRIRGASAAHLRLQAHLQQAALLKKPAESMKDSSLGAELVEAELTRAARDGWDDGRSMVKGLIHVQLEEMFLLKPGNHIKP